jgi:mannose-1-phosphate guanylyltransferase/phosphomannomutase
VKAVVMAGGEGTRLRPLTSNQPKPMVPIVGKPCIEHILELLRDHGMDDVVVTVAFLPQAIRSYFGNGDALGMNISYSVEETPLGTAGSVRLAARELADDAFLVISGDALCDVDLTRLVEFHRERSAAVTIGLVSVENPLEFGIVVTDDEGRVERFLEKPSWSQVFSDTINTGIYVLDPEVIKHIPTDRPFDFSKELFPLLLEMGRPIYGFVLDGYWQDIGNLDQYRQANYDALDGRVRLNITGIQLRGNIWVGDGVELDLDQLEGPAFVGNNCRIGTDAVVGPHTVLGANCTLRERARVERSIVDSGTHIGRSVLVEGAILGRSCDLRGHARLHEGVAIGDEVTIGAESVVYPGVRIYPYKEVESGAQIHESLIWESRATSRVFGKEGVSGLINVDLTPETALRLGAALGTALPRNARVVASREGPPVCRMLKRSVITGLISTGVDVADLRVLPSAVNRQLIKAENYAAGVHVGISANDPEVVRIQFYERGGIQLTASFEKEIEKNFSRHELRRAAAADVGTISYPPRPAESYSESLLASLDVDAIRTRHFRIVVDYGYSAASRVLPLVLGPLGVEAVSAHAFIAESQSLEGRSLHETIGQAKNLVRAVGAELGAVFDRSAERLYLIDEQAREVPVDKALLLYLRLISSNGRHGKLAFPITVTDLVDEITRDSGLEVVRTPASLAELTKAAAADGVVFAGALGGGYVFPEFLPAYDAVASLCNLLELLAPVKQPLSELVAELPASTLVHRQLPCPWALKGLVMRVLTEGLRDRELDLLDGIKLFDERGWAQILPDPDEPLIHIYAEGRTQRESDALEAEMRARVEEIMQSDESASRV